MERSIDKDNVYEIINAISSVVRGTKNTKGIGTKKFIKEQSIIDELRYNWYSYVEALALESILSRVHFKDSLGSNGLSIYNELSDISSKKNEYLDKFKKLMEKQRLGLFDEVSVVSTNYIKYQLDEEGKMGYVLFEGNDKKNMSSLMNSLNRQGNGLINDLDRVRGDFCKESSEERVSRLTKMTELSSDLDYSNIKDLTDTSNLDKIKLDYDKLIREVQSISEVSELFNKYRNYISAETYLKVNSFIEELDKVKIDTINRQNELGDMFNDLRDKKSEEIYGEENVNKIGALLGKISTGRGVDGRVLSREEINEILTKLGEYKQKDKEVFDKAIRKFEVNREVNNDRIIYEFSEDNKNVIKDEMLSSKELGIREDYSNLYNSDNSISNSDFNKLYDMYLKQEVDDGYLFGEIVSRYKEYQDLVRSNNIDISFEEFAIDLISNKESNISM